MNILSFLWNLVARRQETNARSAALSMIYDNSWWKLYEDGYYLMDLYIDGEGIFAVASREGKLYRMECNISDAGDITMGEPQQVMIEFTPTETRTSIKVMRTADNKWRWYAIASVSVLNRSGEIDSRALYDSMIAHAEETGEYPEFVFYHLGEKFRFGQADYLGRDGYLYINSGLFDDTEIAGYAARSIERDGDYWGISIGFIPKQPPTMFEVADGISIPVYEVGRQVEVSLLPEKDAASWGTNIGTVSRSYKVNEKVKKAMKRLLTNADGTINEDLLEQFVEEADTRNRAVEEEGMIARAAEEKPEPTPAAETPAAQVEIDDTLLDAFAQRMEKVLEERLAPINQKFVAIEAFMKDNATVEQTARDASTRADEVAARLKKMEAPVEKIVRDTLAAVPTKTKIIYRKRVDDDPDEEPEGDEDEDVNTLASIREAAGDVTKKLEAQRFNATRDSKS